MGFSGAPVITVEPLQIAEPFEHVDDEGEALPPEVRFLTGILADDVLSAAIGRARESGVTAEAVLLAEGRISSDRYYRALASDLAVPFAEKPLRPASSAVLSDVLLTGLMPLRPNPQGWRF